MIKLEVGDLLVLKECVGEKDIIVFITGFDEHSTCKKYSIKYVSNLKNHFGNKNKWHWSQDDLEENIREGNLQIIKKKNV